MNIPDEVIAGADREFVNDGLPEAYQTIAEWARREALKEAANRAQAVLIVRGSAREVFLAVDELRRKA